MPFRKIPVNVPFWANVEDESRVVVAEQRKDVLKDALGSTIRRPGLKDFASDIIGSISGWYYWEAKDIIVAVIGKDLYKINRGGNATLVGSDLFISNDNVSFAESADLTLITTGAVRKVFIANGSDIVEYDGATAQKISDSDAPTESSHIVMFNSYLLSNELSVPKYDESILYSVVANPISWQDEFFSAENKPDRILAMHSKWDEIALFGSTTIENFYYDIDTPFLPIPGGTVQDGTLSPWTIKFADDAYIFLNSDKRLARLDGRQITEISAPIDDILEDAPDFENAEGEVINLRGKILYLLTINERTFVYDFGLREWVSEWGFWDKTRAKYKRFQARNFLNIKQWGITLCTHPTEASIYQLDFDTYQDFGNEIRSSVITGNIDHGTQKEKRSNALRLKIKRGQFTRTALTDPEPELLVRWRDDGKKKWSNYRTIGLGFTGDDLFFRSLFMLGTYRTRNYEFVSTSNVPFSIVECEEDVELLR